ncbi:MAG: PAS domain-containing protein [Adhaeribacter sp.]
MDALQFESEKLELIADGIHAGLWDWHIQENDQWWSARLYELLGYATGEIDNSFDYFVAHVVHPEDRSQVVEAMNNHFLKRAPFRVEIRLRHKSGTYPWFEATGKAAFDPAGKPRRMCGFLIDITDNKRLRMELELREGLLQEIGAMTRTGGWETDLATRETRWSNELLDILGVDSDFKPTMETILELFGPTYAPLLSQKIRQTIMGGEPWDEELKLQRDRNQEIWVRSIGKPIVDAQGKVKGLRGALQNITEIKLAEELLRASEEKFRRMFELSPLAMTLVDLESGRFRDYNQAFLDITGYGPEELRTLEYKQLIPPNLLPSSTRQVKILLKKGVYGPFESEYIRKDGQHLPVLRNGILTEDSQGNKLVWVFMQDIAEIKKREQMIARLNQELKATNDQKDRMFSIISHDLKGSVGNTDLLLHFLADNADRCPPDTVELIHKAKQSSGIAKDLLEDLLLWARNQMQRVDFQPQDIHLQDLVTHVLHAMQVQADLKGLKLELDIPHQIMVRADKEMLKVILRNLLANAIKYSYTGGKILVQAEDKGSKIAVSVADHGLGISPANLALLFNDKIHHSSPGTLGEKGSGLGLKLCQDFVQKQGGRIMAKSKLKQGSTFIFTLPKPREKSRE